VCSSDLGNGGVTFEEDENKLTLKPAELFRPILSLSITKV